jgi:hypothetical protein
MPYFLQLLATPARPSCRQRFTRSQKPTFRSLWDAALSKSPLGALRFMGSRLGDYCRDDPAGSVLVRFIENPASAMEYRRGGLDYMDEMVGSGPPSPGFPDYRGAPLLGTLFQVQVARAPFKGNASLPEAFSRR